MEVSIAGRDPGDPLLCCLQIETAKGKGHLGISSTSRPHLLIILNLLFFFLICFLLPALEVVITKR